MMTIDHPEPTVSHPQSGLARLHMTVSGRVQGVGFRYFVQDQAIRLKLTGWVRNTHQGEVELVAEGSRIDLEQLRDAVMQGPSSSFVTDIKQSWETATSQYSSFFVASTSY
jgi:acylphosphatase